MELRINLDTPASTPQNQGTPKSRHCPRLPG